MHSSTGVFMRSARAPRPCPWDEAQRREVAGALGVVFEQEVIDVGVGEESLGDQLIAARAEIMTLEIAAAHMHAEHHVSRASGDGIVDAVDIETDQTIRIAADCVDLLRGSPDRKVARSPPRRAGYSGSRPSLRSAISSRKILARSAKKVSDFGIGRVVGEIVAAVEMHGRGRRQRDFRRQLGDAAQEHEFVERQRLRAADLAIGIRRREIDLVAAGRRGT